MENVRPMITSEDTSTPFGTDGVDLVDKNDTRCMFLSHTEQLPNEFWTVTKVLLNEF